MLKSLKRVVYHIDDIEKAKKWYSELLNMQPVFSAPFVSIFNIGDCSLSLTLRKPPIPDGNERTEVYWEVDDIDAVYNRLICMGAKSYVPVKTVFNIRIAKVIDPFGNIIGITGTVSDIKDRTVEHQPSETAMTTAFCRSLAAKEDRKEIVGPDYLAELFLTETARKPLENNSTRKWAVTNLVTSPLYGYLLSRTAYFDIIFKMHLDQNIPQIVFLGAGYDTRAFRFADRIKDTRIFELDIGSTQKRKLTIVKEAKLHIPEKVTFVSINFKEDKIEDVLASYGYRSDRKTLFIWEGVTYYLPEATVSRTLSFVKAHSFSGSLICFDYATEKFGSFNPAEPFQSWIGGEKGNVETYLSGFGIKVLEHIDSMQMQKRFLTLSDGSEAEKVLPQFCIVYGSVSEIN